MPRKKKVVEEPGKKKSKPPSKKQTNSEETIEVQDDTDRQTNQVVAPKEKRAVRPSVRLQNLGEPAVEDVVQNPSKHKNGRGSKRKSIAIDSDQSSEQEDEQEDAHINLENEDEKDLLIHQLMKSQSELLEKVQQLEKNNLEKVAGGDTVKSRLNYTTASPRPETSDEGTPMVTDIGNTSGELFKNPQSRFSSLGQGLDQTLRKKVKDGKFVELAEFLPWYKGMDKATLTLTQTSMGQNILTAKKPKYKLSIDNWNNAYEVYMAVFMEVRPSESDVLRSMLQYKRSINNFASMNSIDWAGYDVHYIGCPKKNARLQFRESAPHYIRA